MPYPQLGVVVLSKYPEYAKTFIESIRKTHEHIPEIVVVADGHNEKFGKSVSVIQANGEFVYAKNANIGIKHFNGRDILLCNDDLVCVEKDFCRAIQAIAYKWPLCGLIAPLVDGGVGNPMQSAHMAPDLWKGLPEAIAITGAKVDSPPVCFPCVLIKAKTVEKVGLLDEDFVGYGMDDNDYCLRTRKAGLWTMITRELVVRHGCGGPGLNRGYNWSCSFARSGEQAKKNNNMEVLKKKHPM